MIWPFNKTSKQITKEALEEFRDEQFPEPKNIKPPKTKEKEMKVTYTLEPDDIGEVIREYLNNNINGYSDEDFNIKFNLEESGTNNVTVKNITVTFEYDN